MIMGLEVVITVGAIVNSHLATVHVQFAKLDQIHMKTSALFVLCAIPVDARQHLG